MGLTCLHLTRAASKVLNRKTVVSKKAMERVLSRQRVADSYGLTG